MDHVGTKWLRKSDADHQEEFDFDGETYEPDRDGERLLKQFQQVRRIMLDGQWHYNAELAAAAKGSESGVAARVRDLRKKKFGGYVVQRQYVSKGLWKYRLILPPE